MGNSSDEPLERSQGNSELDGLFTVCEKSSDSAIVLQPVVNGTQQQVELNTGACVSLISEKIWRESFPE